VQRCLTQWLQRHVCLRSRICVHVHALHAATQVWCSHPQHLEWKTVPSRTTNDRNHFPSAPLDSDLDLRPQPVAPTLNPPNSDTDTDSDSDSDSDVENKKRRAQGHTCSHAESNSGQLRNEDKVTPQRTVITTYTIRADVGGPTPTPSSDPPAAFRVKAWHGGVGTDNQSEGHCSRAALPSAASTALNCRRARRVGLSFLPLVRWSLT
jgi:hypothetical protein